jgi:hypothetical protein
LRLAKIPSDRLLAARDSLDWSLDRIAFYAAAGAGLLPKVPLADLVIALTREEEQARTRSLVNGLQPLYYAAVAIDERLPPPVDADEAQRLSEVLDSLDRFLQADPRRDEGEHIRRRMTSIRRKGSRLAALSSPVLLTSRESREHGNTPRQPSLPLSTGMDELFIKRTLRI